MTQAQLKAKWGKYTDTDKLVTDIEDLLNRTGWRNTRNGICDMLDTYFTQKEPLIQLLQTSSRYAGDMRIVMRSQFERHINAQEVMNLCRWFATKVHADNAILRDVDDYGKRRADYLMFGKRTVSANDFENAEFMNHLSAIRANITSFEDNGTTTASREKFSAFRDLMDHFSYTTAPTLNEETAGRLTQRDASLSIVPGMKTSRAFNHVCTKYGVADIVVGVQCKITANATWWYGETVSEDDRGVTWTVHGIDGNKVTIGDSVVTYCNKKDIDKKYLTNYTYNYEFAKYADMVSGLKRELQFVISLNPYDYLTMSDGINWTSCHSVKNHSMHCGGTMSYMLDNCSIVTYCVEPNENVQTADKVYRNMFHFHDNFLLQARVYPQGNDGNTDLYTVFRQLVQAEFGDLLELNNVSWSVPADFSVYGSYIHSQGAHYADYTRNRECNMTWPLEKFDGEFTGEILLDIGHEGVCPVCGRPIAVHGSLVHDVCKH